MSSLVIALEQIQRPSFWNDFKASRAAQQSWQTNSSRKANSDDMRAEILRVLNHARKPVPRDDLMADMEVTLQSLNGLLKPLLESGHVRRVIVHGRYFYEVGK